VSSSWEKPRVEVDRPPSACLDYTKYKGGFIIMNHHGLHCLLVLTETLAIHSSMEEF
jgi:hypothetical protein